MQSIMVSYGTRRATSARVAADNPRSNTYRYASLVSVAESTLVVSMGRARLRPSRVSTHKRVCGWHPAKLLLSRDIVHGIRLGRSLALPVELSRNSNALVFSRAGEEG